MQKILLSFVGTNDAGKLIGKNDGAILSTLTLRNFDKVYLLWNDATVNGIKYSETVRFLKKEIRKRKLCASIEDIEFSIKSVIDHNEIYQILKSLTDELPKNDHIEYTAAISSGTPAMQVCWILLAESGEFSERQPLKLVQTIPPLNGKPKLLHVKLGTALPVIQKLKRQVKELENSLIPICTIQSANGKITINEKEIVLSPMQFSYYLYFVRRLLNDEGPERIGGYWLRKSFWQSILQIHKTAYPESDSQREKLEQALKDKGDLMITTCRGNLSKLNKELEKQIDNSKLYELFSVSAEGKRGAKFYFIKAPADKFVII